MIAIQKEKYKTLSIAHLGTTIRYNKKVTPLANSTLGSSKNFPQNKSSTSSNMKLLIPLVSLFFSTTTFVIAVPLAAGELVSGSVLRLPGGPCLGGTNRPGVCPDSAVCRMRFLLMFMAVRS